MTYDPNPDAILIVPSNSTSEFKARLWICKPKTSLALKVFSENL